MKMNKIILFVIMMMTPVLLFSKEVKNNKLDGGGNARYKIHTTPATKKIVVRGGAQRLYRFSCGVACVKYEKGYLVVDKQGNKVFDFPEGYHPVRVNAGQEFDYVKFCNDRMLIYKEIKYGSYNVAIIDKRGTIVKDFGEANSVEPFVDGVGSIRKKNGRNTEEFYIDTNGQRIITNTPVYTIHPLHDGLRRIQYNGKWGFVDAKMNIVIPSKFNEVGDFYNGLAYAKNNEGLWGYINKSGEWAIQPQYTNEVGSFKGPYARVYDKTGCSYYIDKKGNIVKKNPKPTECFEFLPEGYAFWIMYSEDVAPAFAPIYIVNSSFQRVGTIDPRILILGFSSGRVATSNSRWFQWNEEMDVNKLFDWKGNLLLDYLGDTFSEDMCSSRDMNMVFYFNDKGEIIVKFEDTLF